MDAVLDEAPFLDFGEDTLYPFRRKALSSVDADSVEDLRALVRQFVPRCPGVYGMLDPRGRLVYVGKSKLLRNRLLSYFLPNNEEDKAGRIVQSTHSIVWETQPNEFAALLREQSLIRHFQPRFNVQGIPRRQQAIYVCLGRPPAEQLYTARRRDPKATTVLGPLAGAARAGRAVEVLNRVYHLRDCSSKQACSFTDQLQLFEIDLRPGCIRLELNTCLGPCISACSRGDYEAQVNEARAFLLGASALPVEQLQAAIERAVANLQFERAAILRDDLRAISWLHRRAVDLATARDHYTFIYPVASANPKTPAVWYLIRKGMVEGAMAEPRTVKQKATAARKLDDWLASDQCVGTQFAARKETLALVTSWFRKHRAELRKTFLPQPDALASSVA